MTEANEFWKIYKLDVVAMPTNRPMKRVNYADVILSQRAERSINAVRRRDPRGSRHGST